MTSTAMPRQHICVEWKNVDGEFHKPRRLHLENDNLVFSLVQYLLEHEGFGSKRGCRKHVKTKHPWYIYFDTKPSITNEVDTKLRPVSNVEFYMHRIQLFHLSSCKVRRLKQLNSTFLIAVDLSFKFDRLGRIMHAKCDVVSDVAFCMHRIQLIYPFYRLLSSSLRTGNYFAHKTSCNAYKCDEIGHMFFYSAPIPPKI